MKTTSQTIKNLFLSILFLTVVNTVAQAPQKFSYQTVVRNASNALVANANVGIKITILQGSATGTSVYSESHTAATNANGLASIQIGGGSVLNGNLTTINWSTGTYFIKTEVDPAGGTAYSISGTTQLLSVPYALSSADNKWTTAGNNISNNNSGNVGIGVTTPNAKLDVLGGNWDLTGTSAGDFRVGNATNNFKLGIATGGGGAGHTTMTSTLMLSLGSGTTNPNVRTLNIGNGNVGIGTITPTTKLEVNGFTKLGNDAPAIKFKELSGTTATTQNGWVDINHGLDFNKIISVNVLVLSNGSLVPSSYSRNGYEFDFFLTSTNISIWNTPSNSSNILNKPIKILITYKE